MLRFLLVAVPVTGIVGVWARWRYDPRSRERIEQTIPGSGAALRRALAGGNADERQLSYEQGLRHAAVADVSRPGDGYAALAGTPGRVGAASRGKRYDAADEPKSLRAVGAGADRSNGRRDRHAKVEPVADSTEEAVSGERKAAAVTAATANGTVAAHLPQHREDDRSGETEHSAVGGEASANVEEAPAGATALASNMETSSTAGANGNAPAEPSAVTPTSDPSSASATLSESTSVTSPSEMLEQVPPDALVSRLSQELGVFVLAEAVRLHAILDKGQSPRAPPTTTASSSSSSSSSALGRSELQARRALALELLQRERDFRADLERYLSALKRKLRREIEPEVHEAARAEAEQLLQQRETELRQRLEAERETQLALLREQELLRLQQVEALAQQVGEHYGRDREYKRFSQWAHRVWLLWRGMADKVTAGEPFATELDAWMHSWRECTDAAARTESDTARALQASAALVQAVCTPVPHEAALQGVATTGELEARFLTRVFPQGRVAALMRGRDNVLGYLLARLAATLKTDEWRARGVLFADAQDAPPPPPATAEEVYLQARACVLRGDLHGAVRLLEQLDPQTLPATICRDWVLAAREHLLLRQAVRACDAESRTLAAALC